MTNYRLGEPAKPVKARHQGKLPITVLSILKEAKKPMTSIEIAKTIGRSNLSRYHLQLTLRRLLEAGVLEVQRIDRVSSNGPRRLWSLVGK